MLQACEGEGTATSSCTGGSCSSGSGSGEVKSPNYPSNYPDNSDTSTPITVAAGSRIELTFVDFNIESHSSCGYDYVEGKRNETKYFTSYLTFSS